MNTVATIQIFGGCQLVKALVPSVEIPTVPSGREALWAPNQTLSCLATFRLCRWHEANTAATTQIFGGGQIERLWFQVRKFQPSLQDGEALWAPNQTLSCLATFRLCRWHEANTAATTQIFGGVKSKKALVPSAEIPTVLSGRDVLWAGNQTLACLATFRLCRWHEANTAATIQIFGNERPPNCFRRAFFNLRFAVQVGVTGWLNHNNMRQRIEGDAPWITAGRKSTGPNKSNQYRRGFAGLPKNCLLRLRRVEWQRWGYRCGDHATYG